MPTYLVSGEVPALTVQPPADTQQSESAMDIDLEFEEDREEVDVVCQSKVLLVDARTLDGAYLVHTTRLTPIFRLGLRGQAAVFSHTFRAYIQSIAVAVRGAYTSRHILDALTEKRRTRDLFVLRVLKFTKRTSGGVQNSSPLSGRLRDLMSRSVGMNASRYILSPLTPL